MRGKSLAMKDVIPVNMPEKNTMVACKFTCAQHSLPTAAKRPALACGKCLVSDKKCVMSGEAPSVTFSNAKHFG